MNIRQMLVLTSILGLSLMVLGQKALPRPFYRNQIALQLGFGQTSAPGVVFPFSSGFGAYVRRDRHALGFRQDYHTELEIFKEATFYRFRSVYYGNAWVLKNTVLMPQLGIGSFKSNFPTGQNREYSGLAAEIGIEGSWLNRGNGIGARVFFNWNKPQPYVGLHIMLNLGYSWMKQ